MSNLLIFPALPTDPYGEMHLQPSPLFHLPSDNVSMLGAVGTSLGRIFLAGKDSCLYEVVYQVGHSSLNLLIMLLLLFALGRSLSLSDALCLKAEDGWFSKKCRKVNHSQSSLSFLIPSFLSFSDEGPVTYQQP